LFVIFDHLYHCILSIKKNIKWDTQDKIKIINIKKNNVTKYNDKRLIFRIENKIKNNNLFVPV